MLNTDSYSPSRTAAYDDDDDDDDDDTLQLPAEVLIEHVIPFLDRQSLSRFGTTNKEFNIATSNLVQNLPWPTKLISDHHLSTINCIAFSPDNQMLVAGCSDGSIALWDVKTGQLPSLEGVHWPGQAVTSIVFSKDGKLMASASTDHTIVIWRCCCCSSSRSGSCYKKDDSSLSTTTTTTTRMATWKKIHSGHVTCLTFSPNGDFLVSGHAYQERIKVWNLTTGSCTAEFRDTNNNNTQVLSVKVSNDNRDIRTTLSDGSIKIWNILRGTYDIWVGGHINAVGQLPSGGIVVASSLSSPTSYSSMMQDNNNQQQHQQQNTCALTLWNKERQKTFHLLLDDEHPSTCCFSTDASKLASLHNSYQNNSSIIIWNVETGQVETTITAKEGDDDDDDDEPTRGSSFDLLIFSDDSKLLAAVSTRENQIRLIRT